MFGLGLWITTLGLYIQADYAEAVLVVFWCLHRGQKTPHKDAFPQSAGRPPPEGT